MHSIRVIHRVDVDTNVVTDDNGLDVLASEYSHPATNDMNNVQPDSFKRSAERQDNSAVDTSVD